MLLVVASSYVITLPLINVFLTVSPLARAVRTKHSKCNNLSITRSKYARAVKIPFWELIFGCVVYAVAACCSCTA
eukprot:517214-Pyramimonas_sp.AAC.1